MKWLKGFLGLVIILLLAAVIAVVVIINPFGASPLNKYTKDGNLPLPGLKEPVTVHRDEKGMAYIYARNLEDLSIAQGFIAAQDRLFQMELTRLFASGRIAELAGEKAKGIDVRMRTLGFYRNAKKQKRDDQNPVDSQGAGHIRRHTGAENQQSHNREVVQFRGSVTLHWI